MERLSLWLNMDGMLWMVSSSVAIFLADLRNSSPSLVRRIPLCCRQKMGKPSSCSRFLMHTLKFGCSICRFWAALLMEPHSTISITYSKYLISIDNPSVIYAAFI